MMFSLVGRKVASRILRSVAPHLGRLEGQGMIEYALLIMLIGTIMVVVLMVMGNQLNNAFHNVSCALSALGGSCTAPAPPAPPAPPLPAVDH